VRYCMKKNLCSFDSVQHIYINIRWKNLKN
jgi:hypothetical protein